MRADSGGMCESPLGLGFVNGGSKNDIFCQVIRRKISGGTRSHAGRSYYDAFLGLLKT